MRRPNNGGPAFAGKRLVRMSGDVYKWEPWEGMSLREWLAGMAMKELIREFSPYTLINDDPSSGHTARATRTMIWKAAIAMADDGIAELERGTP